ncbi:NnrS family protein [Granulosicoccaceae sp. 1_MG-2023]|nr:NnrS family protein [Granulosicoccaceae sp. 1_MG-2023]
MLFRQPAAATGKPAPALLQRGFRPFFLLAMAYAALAIGLWAYSYFSGARPAAALVLPTYWHAHEMLFGFATAVIAGFLLTAVTNWTGKNTATGWPLAVLALLWLGARVLPYSGTPYALPAAAVSDLLFGLGLFVATARPLLQARQWPQAGIISKLLLLVLCNAAFYAGAFGLFSDGGRSGLYAAFYLVLALILTLLRRVLPFFIQGAAGPGVQLRNNRLVDIAGLVLFLVFAIAELVRPYSNTGALLAGVLVLLHGYRLAGWYHPIVFRRALLWILFVGYLWLIAGFALHALAVFAGFNPYLSVHAFAVGGIGMITIGMMTRVALGHTGRNVFEPPAALGWLFLSLAGGALVRVLLPLVSPGLYGWWIGLSMSLWILAFAGVFLVYRPMLTAARVDGAPG